MARSRTEYVAPRGYRATMKLNRDGFAFYPEVTVRRESTALPEPEIEVMTDNRAYAELS